MSERRDLATTILETTDALIVVDPQARITYFNRACEELSGYSRGEVVGRVLWDFLLPERYIELVKQVFAGLLTGRLPGRFENAWLTKGGEERVISWSNDVVRDAQGKVTQVIGTGIDITERKRAEERSAHLANMLRAIRNVNQLIAQERDKGRLIQSTCDLLVETRGLVNAWILLTDEDRDFVSLAGAGHQGAFSTLADHIKRGDYPPCVRDLLEGQEPFLTYNGLEQHAACPLASICEVSGAFVARLGYRGKAYGVLGGSVQPGMALDEEETGLFREVAGDISYALHSLEMEEERRRVEEALRLRSQELEALFNIASILVQSGSFEERRARVVEELASVAQADRVVLRLLHEKGQELRLVAEAGEGKRLFPPMMPLSAFRDTIAGPALGCGEAVVVNDYGSHPQADPRLISVGVKSIAWLPVKAGDRILGLVSIHSLEPDHFTPRRVRLLTAVADGIGVLLELARLYEEASSARALAKLNEMKSRLLSTVSHELRTPLGAIKGYATMMLDYGERLSRSERRDYLVLIDRSCDRLTELIEHLLDASRLEAGTLRIDKRLCDLREVLVKVAVRISQGLVGHRLVADIPERFPAVEADERRIEQVLENLLGNAVKYSPQGGEIRLRGELRDPEIVVSVNDQGIGIEEEELEEVFASFFRIEAGRAGKTPGAGLGLAVCKGLVEAHGGRIWAESEPGKGSTFYFTLPLPQEEERVGKETEDPGHRGR